MFVTVPARNGSGFGLEGKDSTLRFLHYGSNEGYTCFAVSYTGTGKGFVIMTNSDNGFPLIKEISNALLKAYGWDFHYRQQRRPFTA